MKRYLVTVWSLSTVDSGLIQTGGLPSDAFHTLMNAMRVVACCVLFHEAV